MKFKAFILCFFLPFISWAQQMEVSGTVISAEDNMPLPGVNIFVQGTSKGTVTDFDGNYSLENVEPGATLVFSYIGFETREEPVGGRSRIDVSLTADTEMLSEVVITGYQQIQRENYTGAVSVVEMDEVAKQSNTNILQALEGRVSGLRVATDGSPGGGAGIRLRGITNSDTTNDSPLFVIDGVPTQSGLNTLNPNDIAEIQVLKDGASASIYGARASGGVIVIRTKKGKGEQLNFTFNTFSSLSFLRDDVDVLDAFQWSQVYWQAQRNDGATPSHPQYGNGLEPEFPDFIDEDGLVPAGNTNWQNEIYRTGIKQYYDIGLSKGFEDGQIFASASYTDVEGTMKYTNYQRLTVRMNSDFTLFDRLKISENLSVVNQREINSNVAGTAISQHPLIPVYDSQGDFAGPYDGLGDQTNPLATLYRNRNNQNKGWRIFGSAIAELDLFEGLKFTSRYTVDYGNNYGRNYAPVITEGYFGEVEQESSLTTYSNYGIEQTFNNFLTYENEFGDHGFNLLAGMERVKYENEFFDARREGYILDDPNYTYLSSGSGEQFNAGGGLEWRLQSYFGKLDYDYDDKYLLSGTLRYDESSRFPGNEGDFFPAVSAGWNIHNEDFFPEENTFSRARLRGSWGVTGNQNSGYTYPSYNLFGYRVDYSPYPLSGQNSGTLEQGFNLVQRGITGITWETTTDYNAGFDLGFLNNRILISADYFIKETENILLFQKLPGTANVEAGDPLSNAGTFETKGWDASIHYQNDASTKFQFSLDAQFSGFVNEVTEIDNGESYFFDSPVRGMLNNPYRKFYGYVADGLFRTEEEIDRHAIQPGAGLGRIRYADINEDGVINAQDRTFIGDFYPDFAYGFNFNAEYKNFDLAMNFSGEYGKDLYNGIRGNEFTYGTGNWSTAVLDAWSPDNFDSNIPAVNLTNPNDELRASSYFIEDASYLKLQSLTFGYNLDANYLERIRMKSLRLYLQGENLFTITDYSGLDPELEGVSGAIYPIPRVFTIGLNLQF
ncbi:SusC/RagA family TonB-linked outer membrane protein [Salinimicrobium sediminilitoris]|uniref:SusC/RagA family TonB-linked outer membrane protein n=1 Tax=Salinimicrobium sediminilitoris TaxID=2876715 RepID=UPI001E2BBFF8|nr:TonB-dependent receptor [Salinimicrobium sediminilitoris]MCC8360641.1 TonB-dependent receptor [Salinimicrobium sediminilitoris]